MTQDYRRVPIAGPWITDREVEAVADAARTAWYENAGTVITDFESSFAERTGRRFAISLPSCTSGLHLALAALDVGPGDDVIVPESTWIATSAPISYVGASPRFADVDAEHWCLSADTLRAAITPRTKAAIVVDLYGSMPPMDELGAVCDEHGIALIEDSAEAAGSTYWGKPAGSFGVASTFSFHGSKTLTTGEGGMVLADDERLYERMMKLRDHGRPPGDTAFFNDEVAFKYKMSSLQAALGLVQLQRLGELVDRKREIFGWYRDRLGDLEGVTLNAEPLGVKNSYWMVTAIFDEALGVEERPLAAMLNDHGIATRPFFHPLSALPAYVGFPGAIEAREANVVSARLAKHGINLPSALMLDESQVDYVCSWVQAYLRDRRESDLDAPEDAKEEVGT
jgi:perosamine synthetase